VLDLDLRGSDCKSASPPVTESNPSTCIMNVSLSRSRLARRSSSQPPPRAGFATERKLSPSPVAALAPTGEALPPRASISPVAPSRRFHWARHAISAPSLVVPCSLVVSRAVSRDRQDDHGEVMADESAKGARRIGRDVIFGGVASCAAGDTGKLRPGRPGRRQPRAILRPPVPRRRPTRPSGRPRPRKPARHGTGANAGRLRLDGGAKRHLPARFSGPSSLSATGRARSSFSPSNSFQNNNLL